MEKGEDNDATSELNDSPAAAVITASKSESLRALSNWT